MDECSARLLATNWMLVAPTGVPASRIPGRRATAPDALVVGFAAVVSVALPGAGLARTGASRPSPPSSVQPLLLLAAAKPAVAA